MISVRSGRFTKSQGLLGLVVRFQRKKQWIGNLKDRGHGRQKKKNKIKINKGSIESSKEIYFPWSHWPNFYLKPVMVAEESAKILNVESRYSESEKTPGWMTLEKICFTVRLLFFNFSSLLLCDRFPAASTICVKILRNT